MAIFSLTDTDDPTYQSAYEAAQQTAQKVQGLPTSVITAVADIHIPTLQDFLSLARNAGFARTDRFAVSLTAPTLMSSGAWQARDIVLLCEEAAFPSKSIQTRPFRINGLTEQRAHTLDYGNDISLTFLVDQSWQIRLFFEEWFRLCIGESSMNDANLSSGPLREVEFYSNYIQDIAIASLAPIGQLTPYPALGNGIIGGLVSDAKAFVTSTLNTATAGIKGNVLGQSFSNIAQQLLGITANTILPINNSTVPEVPTVPAEKPIYTVVLHECFPKTMDIQPMSSNATNQYHRLKITFAYKYYTTHEQLPEQTN